MTESEYGGPVVTRIVALAQPILDDLGLTLYDCEHAGGTLIITLDKRRDADRSRIGCARIRCAPRPARRAVAVHPPPLT